MMRKFTRLASDGLPKSDGLSLVDKEGITLIVFNDFFDARKLHYSHCVQAIGFGINIEMFDTIK